MYLPVTQSHTYVRTYVRACILCGLILSFLVEWLVLSSVVWYDDGEDVDFGNGGSTVPQLGIDMVAGKPNGRYFPFSPPKLSEQDKTSKRIMKKSQVCPLLSSFRHSFSSLC